MFNPHFRFGTPTGGDLLTELGVRPELVREVTEDERAIRCPDRGAVYPEHRMPSFYPDSLPVLGLHEAGPAEPWGPAPARRRAGRRSRRA